LEWLGFSCKLTLAEYKLEVFERDFFFGMYTTTDQKGEPEEFSAFNFLIDEAPDFNFKIYNIPSYRMMQAGRKAGFSRISYISQYPAQTEKENIVI